LVQWIDLSRKTVSVEVKPVSTEPVNSALSEIKEQQHVISLISKAEDNKEKRLITHRIEALALVFLCCPYTKIR
jgi:hypothetical protein